MVSEIKSAPGAIYGVGWSPDSQTVFTLDCDWTSTTAPCTPIA